VWATAETLAIMARRFGPQPGGVAMAYGTKIMVGDIAVTFVPAGHVLGSAQIVLERDAETIVVSGDYKRRADATCAPFQPVPCDIFITEATFGLPVFRHPDDGAEIQKVIDTLALHPDRCVLIGAYALGKAQRVMMLLRQQGYDKPIYVHGALLELCKLYQDFGVDLGEIVPVAKLPVETFKNHVVMCPPSALNDKWSRRLPEPITAMASGWMRVRMRAKQRNVELPLIISDHCDWDELTQTLLDVRPKEVWVTHGREEALVHWCAMQQIKAKALSLVGREDDAE
jgi:putative mRNA 3-end processing factor